MFSFRSVWAYKTQFAIAFLIVSSQAIACIATPLDNGQILVHLKNSKASVTSKDIKVRDVAQITGGTEQQRNAIGELIVDSFTRNATRLGIQQDQVKYRILLAGISRAQFTVAGVKALTVSQQPAFDIRQWLEQKLSAQMASQFGLKPEQVSLSVEQKTISELQKAKLDLWNCSLLPEFGTQLHPGKNSFRVQVNDHTGNGIATRMNVNVALIRDVVIANRNISKGELMDANDVVVVRRPISDRNLKFASFEQVVGKRANSDIQQFAVVQSRNVSNIQSNDFDLDRNKLVNAYLKYGSLMIEIKNARTVTRGKIGQTIEIINPISNKRMLATVIDHETVQIR